MDKPAEEEKSVSVVSTMYDPKTDTKIIKTAYTYTRPGMSAIGSREEVYCGDQTEIDAIIEEMNK